MALRIRLKHYVETTNAGNTSCGGDQALAAISARPPGSITVFGAFA